jgi:phytoene desaturase
MEVTRSAIVIGSGFAGISAASFLAREGWKVTVIEKNAGPGGRAAQLKDAGFTFDMGPSFYWMPDVFERYFNQFGKKAADYYELKRLDPSYRVYWDDGYTDIPADLSELKMLFESIEPGSSVQLEKYLAEAKYKYEVGIHQLVFQPGLSVTEYLSWSVLKGVLRLDIITSIKNHIAKHFRNPKLRQLMEFPVLFLGALPEDTPALYSLMNYADIKGGTWYPAGGMYAVVQAMYDLAVELGVNFVFNEEAQSIVIDSNVAQKVIGSRNSYQAHAIVSGADYHFTEMHLLPPSARSYSDRYWKKKVMAPSCLLYYVGLNKKLKNVEHHSLFFDVPFDQHGQEIYADPRWPANPLFYVSIPSVTDPSVAPAGHENMVFLVPVAAGLGGDTAELRSRYFDMIVERMEQRTGQSIRDAIVYQKSYSISDFIQDYHSFRGNAYGLANTLRQTAIFRPSCRSKKVRNLFYTGQLTVPGPGVPPSLISGEVVTKQVIKSINQL